MTPPSRSAPKPSRPCPLGPNNCSACRAQVRRIHDDAKTTLRDLVNAADLLGLELSVTITPRAPAKRVVKSRASRPEKKKGK